MGHLINPVSLRLSINSFWNSNWTLINTFNYVNVFKKDYLLFYFLNWFTKKSKFLKFNILMSHYKLYRSNNNVYVSLYYYNADSINNDSKKILDNLLKKSFFTDSDSNLDNLKFNIANVHEYVLKKLIFYLYWIVLNKTLSFFFSKINKKTSFELNIYSLDSLNISAEAITSYLSLKLQKRYSLNWVLKPILKDLSTKIKRRDFVGYKIVCSGRFTRKQIATYMWMKDGSLRLNTISNLIKYSEARVRLKYGLCGIKIWINYGSNNRSLLNRHLLLMYPVYIPLKFSLCNKSNELTLYLNSWFYSYIRIIFFKLRSYNFYKNYIDIKLKMLINFLLERVLTEIFTYKYSLRTSNNNIFVISFKPRAHNYVSLHKEYFK